MDEEPALAIVLGGGGSRDSNHNLLRAGVVNRNEGSTKIVTAHLRNFGNFYFCSEGNGVILKVYCFPLPIKALIVKDLMVMRANKRRWRGHHSLTKPKPEHLKITW